MKARAGWWWRWMAQRYVKVKKTARLRSARRPRSAAQGCLGQLSRRRCTILAPPALHAHASPSSLLPPARPSRVQDSISAFHWTLRNIYRPGDQVFVLHVMPDLFSEPASGSIYYCPSGDPETERCLVGGRVE